MHRNRTRPADSLRDRLLAMAKLARQKAEACTDDQARELLLRKAAHTERTAAMEKWINSPGAAPPARRWGCFAVEEVRFGPRIEHCRPCSQPATSPPGFQTLQVAC